jgi:hypothetical protein
VDHPFPDLSRHLSTIRQQSQRIMFESGAEMLDTFGLQLGRSRRGNQRPGPVD